jgi:pimeloyl-ACP methyl ester carboxylesterase
MSDHPSTLDVAGRKSTTVRADAWKLRFIRSVFRGLSAVAPSTTERIAARLFSSPRRKRQATPPIVAGVEASETTIEHGGYRLAVSSWGAGPAVLLVHGWEGHAGQMARLASRLVTRGFRAVTFDMPAHGRSTGDRVNVVQMAAAIRAVAGEVGPVCGVVAHSLGGAATAVALRDGLEVQRVVMLAPAAEPTYFARRLGALLGLPEARTEGMLRRICRELGGDWGRVSVPEFAPSMTAQLLLMHDPQDRDVPWEHGESIALAWPDADLKPVGGLGHRNILKSRDVIEATVAFLDGRAAGSCGGRFGRPLPGRPRPDWAA